MMWGSDYPHSESTFPQSRKILAGVPEDEQAKPAPDHDPETAGGTTARGTALAAPQQPDKARGAQAELGIWQRHRIELQAFTHATCSRFIQVIQFPLVRSCPDLFRAPT